MRKILIMIGWGSFIPTVTSGVYKLKELNSKVGSEIKLKLERYLNVFVRFTAVDLFILKQVDMKNVKDA